MNDAHQAVTRCARLCGQRPPLNHQGSSAPRRRALLHGDRRSAPRVRDLGRPLVPRRVAVSAAILILCGCQSAPAEQTVTVTAVHDGDTVTLAGGLRVRIAGIDAPELVHSAARKTAQCDDRAAAIRARDWLTRRVLNRQITLVGHGTDRYGRLVADIADTAGDIGQDEIRAGLAVRWPAQHGNVCP